MHSLRYEVILQMLQQFGYSGEARANIAPSVLLREGGIAILMAQEGKITASLIVHQNGRKLYNGTAAKNILSHLGRLEWELVEIHSRAMPPPVATLPVVTPMKRTDTFYPRRITVPSSTIHQWAKQLRSVYLLADGTHNIEQISRLLSCSRALVEEALQKLRSLGALE